MSNSSPQAPKSEDEAMAASYTSQVAIPTCPSEVHGRPSLLLANTSGRAVILILFLALKAGVAVAATSTLCELSMRAIVNGHNIQPRADCLKALGRSDLPPQAADEIDRLYQDLMRDSTFMEQVPH